MLSVLQKETDVCAVLALKYFRSTSLRVQRKADRSPVTQADRAIEARLRRFLARHFPGEHIVGEEFGGAATAPDSYWTIDPIDGTRAFSRGLPFWGIMIGRVERGRPTLGLIDYPALGVTIATAPGVPAYERIGRTKRLLPRVPKPPAVKDAVILHGGASWWGQTRYAKGFNRLIQSCYLERAYGDCYGYLWALRGHADAVIDNGVKIWDMVPLAALAHATGRVLVNVSGQPSWTGPDTVFAAPTFARKVCRILRS
jgi:histidinol-phosphatase